MSGYSVFDDEVRNLGDFSTDLVFSSVAKCLNFINSTTKADGDALFPSPPKSSTSARYDYGSRLASRIRALGYKNEELGYQTFLYGNERDIRNLLMFLIDKLPRDTDEPEADAGLKGKKEELLESLGIELERQFNDFWVPPFRPGIRVRPDGPMSKYSGDHSIFLSDDSRKKSKDLLRSLISCHSECLLDKTDEVRSKTTPEELRLVLRNKLSKTDRSKTFENRVRFDNIGEDDSFIIPRAHLSLIISKEVNISKLEEERKERNRLLQEDLSKLEEERKERNRLLQEDLSKLQEEYKQLRDQVMECRKKLKVGEFDVTTRSSLISQAEAELERKKKLANLIPEGEENLSKLKSLAKKNKQKLGLLREQWIEIKKNSDEEYRNILSEIENEREIKEKELETSESLKEKIRETKIRIKKKDSLKQKYDGETSKMKTGPTRTVYTKKILKLLENVQSQEAETISVIDEIRSVQKDVNSLMGKLERTYAETDKAVFTVLKKLYRMTVERVKAVTTSLQN